MAEKKSLSFDGTGNSLWKEIGSPDVNAIPLGKVENYLDFSEIAAPPLSPAGSVRVYFDSTSKKWRASQNGAAYEDVISAGGGGLGGTASANRLAFGQDGSTLTFDTNFRVNPTEDSLWIGAEASSRPAHLTVGHGDNTDYAITSHFLSRYTGGSTRYLGYFEAFSGLGASADGYIALDAPNDTIFEFRESVAFRRAFLQYDKSATDFILANDFAPSAARITLKGTALMQMTGVMLCDNAIYEKSAGVFTLPVANTLLQPTLGNSAEVANTVTQIDRIRKNASAIDGSRLHVTKSLEGSYGSNQILLKHNLATSGSDFGLWLAAEQDRVLKRGESITFVLETLETGSGTERKWVEVASSNPHPRVLHVGSYVDASTNAAQADATINVVASSTSKTPSIYFHQEGMTSPRDFALINDASDLSLIGSIRKVDAAGGLHLSGYCANQAAGIPLRLDALHGHVTPTVPLMKIRAGKSDTIGDAEAVSDTTSMMEFSNWDDTNKQINLWGDAAVSIGSAIKLERLHVRNFVSEGDSFARFTTLATGQTPTDGFRVGVLGSTSDVEYRNYETTNHVWYSGETVKFMEWSHGTLGLNLGFSGHNIGLYGATPVPRATTSIAEEAFVENAGGAVVNEDSTFAGYTLQQIANALKLLGVLT